jgi:competence protein ComEA
MLNLTRQEKIVIQFLVACFLVGAALHLYKTRTDRIEYEENLHTKVAADSFQLQAMQIDSEYVVLRSDKDRASADKQTISLQSKINLNTATKQDLMSLPKIGAVTADRILEYRTRVGRFSNIDELKNVKGIGNQTFERIKGEITLE